MIKILLLVFGMFLITSCDTCLPTEQKLCDEKCQSDFGKDIEEGYKITGLVVSVDKKYMYCDCYKVKK